RHLLHGDGGHLLYGRERQGSSPLPERTRAHERRVSPAPFEIASSQFAMAAGPGRPGALLGWCLIFDLLTSYELLSAPHPCSKTAAQTQSYQSSLGITTAFYFAISRIAQNPEAHGLRTEDRTGASQTPVAGSAGPPRRCAPAADT